MEVEALRMQQFSIIFLWRESTMLSSFDRSADKLFISDGKTSRGEKVWSFSNDIGRALSRISASSMSFYVLFTSPVKRFIIDLLKSSTAKRLDYKMSTIHLPDDVARTAWAFIKPILNNSGSWVPHGWRGALVSRIPPESKRGVYRAHVDANSWLNKSRELNFPFQSRPSSCWYWEDESITMRTVLRRKHIAYSIEASLGGVSLSWSTFNGCINLFLSPSPRAH